MRPLTNGGSGPEWRPSGRGNDTVRAAPIRSARSRRRAGPRHPRKDHPSMKLSILMPVYNERNTLENAVKRVLGVDYPVDVELVIVDDGSIDGTRDLYAQWADDSRVVLHQKPTNGGKGSAIRKAGELATGDY